MAKGALRLIRNVRCSSQQACKRNCLEQSVAELKSMINSCCLLSACAECRAVLQMESGSEGRGEEKKARSVRCNEEKGDQTAERLELNRGLSNNGNKGLTGIKHG